MSSNIVTCHVWGKHLCACVCFQRGKLGVNACPPWSLQVAQGHSFSLAYILYSGFGILSPRVPGSEKVEVPRHSHQVAQRFFVRV